MLIKNYMIRLENTSLQVRSHLHRLSSSSKCNLYKKDL